MCGIAGVLDPRSAPAGDSDTVRRMLKLLEHRGPEIAGMATVGPVTLGHARLSMIDLAGGVQPIPNEDETLWVIVNGEVFNYVELTEALRARGHRFRTASDSEVILHLYEECGPALLDQLNGQYAFALWDATRGRLLLGRDRLGVRPLFYTRVDGALLFASEIKALLADHRVPRRVDAQSLDQLFTFWSLLPGRTMFEGIREVPAGHYLVAETGDPAPTVRDYWRLRYDAPERAARDADACAAQLRGLLIDATRLRLRADVPVGAYLSGGLDSSTIAAIARHYTGNRLQTFSVAFADQDYDERTYQERMAAALGVDHHVVQCSRQMIGEIFPDIIWHAETPLLRTAPAPMFVLSALVHRHGLKVVLTGEGADEFFGGYNIFKEALVRRFWSRQPASHLRPALLRGIYDWLPSLQRSPQAFLEAFFRQGLLDVDDPAYSHRLRWRNTMRLKQLFSPQLRATLAWYDSQADLRAQWDPLLETWEPLSQAQYLEVLTFLTPYLLSSQGDRMGMAHSVEGRFPFLDHRVVEFSTTIPPRLHLHGLSEKWLLRRAVADLIPPEIQQRPKRPYRAPIGGAFIGPGAPGYVRDLLSPPAVRDAGLFDPAAVSRLLSKCDRQRPLGENDEMALVGVLSGQLWHQRFIQAFDSATVEPYPAVIDVAAAARARMPA